MKNLENMIWLAAVVAVVGACQSDGGDSDWELRLQGLNERQVVDEIVRIECERERECGTFTVSCSFDRDGDRDCTVERGEAEPYGECVEDFAEQVRLELGSCELDSELRGALEECNNFFNDRPCRSLQEVEAELEGYESGTLEPEPIPRACDELDALLKPCTDYR